MTPGYLFADQTAASFSQGGPMADTQTYTGGCHCGAVRYEATLALDPVISCNCSICTKRGSLLSFTTKDQFKLLSGGDDLVDYQFNKHVIHHLFCPKCGTESFARGQRPDGQEMIAINVRCLDSVDVGALKTTSFDGRSK
jgi:hypothetical protein